MTKRSKPQVTALKLAFFPLKTGGPTKGILTPVSDPCRALLCIFLGAAGPQAGRTRSPAERKMRRTGHWAPRQNVRDYGGRALGSPGLERTGSLLRTIRTRRSQPARWLALQSEHRNERKRMDAGAPHDAAPHAPGQGASESPALPADPMSRLEAEIERTDQRSGAAAPQETERLLEETWSLFTECLVIRDGLLEACDEIERTMGSLQHRFGALPAGVQQSHQYGHAGPSNGSLAQADGTSAIGPHSNGNGAHVHPNGSSANRRANGSSPNEQLQRLKRALMSRPSWRADPAAAAGAPGERGGLAAPRGRAAAARRRRPAQGCEAPATAPAAARRPSLAPLACEPPVAPLPPGARAS